MSGWLAAAAWFGGSVVCASVGIGCYHISKEDHKLATYITQLPESRISDLITEVKESKYEETRIVKVIGQTYAPEAQLVQSSKGNVIIKEERTEELLEEYALKETQNVDSAGNVTKVSQWTKNEIRRFLASTTTGQNIFIRDKSDGYIKIEDIPSLYQFFQQGSQQFLPLQGGGGTTVNVSLLGMSAQPAPRVIGHRVTERVVPLGKKMFVIGQAMLSDGEVVMRPPGEREKGLFICSTGTPYEYANKLRDSGDETRIVGHIFSGVSVLLLLAGVYNVRFSD